MRYAQLAPLRVFSFQLDYTRSHFLWRPVWVFRRPALEFVQGFITTGLKTRLPILKRAFAHMRFLTGFSYAACRFPGFKQQPSLLCRCWWIVRAFLFHSRQAYPILPALSAPCM